VTAKRRVSLAAAPPPASAASIPNACRSAAGNFKARLRFDDVGHGWWDAHVDTDVHMLPEQHARSGELQTLALPTGRTGYTLGRPAAPSAQPI
jgi:hypothetical protein